MVNNIAATERDFDNLARTFNDPTWSYKNMRNYFKRIEHNLYLNKSNLDHGFHGWLKTSINPASIAANPQFAGLLQADSISITNSNFSLC
jgi:choline dehydrogenase